MPGARHKILGLVTSGFCHKMNRRKPIRGDPLDVPLNRCLSTLDITLLGIGHMIGSGIYVTTGVVARYMAGPATCLSFLMAGFSAGLSALCYAEFGTRIPRAGSAYAYIYVSIGEFWAFIIGWNVILEYMIAAAAVARTWSGYLDTLFDGAISNGTKAITGEIHDSLLSSYPDVMAFFICIAATIILAVGVKTSAYINNVLTILNLIVISLIIIVGFCYADIENWSSKHGGFIPFGLDGISVGAAGCFYAFVGFDSISASSEEVKNPTRSIPLATLISFLVVTTGYVLVSIALTLMVPYDTIDVEAALPIAFGAVHADWAKYAVTIGACCGMTTTLLGSMFALPRCLYAMSVDGLIFGFFKDVKGKTQIPLINVIISGLISALIALTFDLQKLVEFMSIGTLIAYTIVSAAVIIIRYRPEEDDGCYGIQSESLDHHDGSSLASTPTNNGQPPQVTDPTMIGRVKPDNPRTQRLFGNWPPGMAVATSVYGIIIFSSVFAVYRELYIQEPFDDVLFILPEVAMVLFITYCMLLISSHNENPEKIPFSVPLVPYLPILSIMTNVILLSKLSSLTWIRFGVWIAIGLLMYFLYGIHHSKLGEGSTLLLNRSVSGGWGAVDDTSASTRRVTKINKGYIADDEKPILKDMSISTEDP